HLGAHAVLLALVAEGAPPLPRGDDHFDRAVERVEAHRPGAAEDERADVAGLEAVAHDHLMRRRADLLLGERDLHVVERRAAEQPVDVIGVAEDRGAARRLIRAHALEDTGAVVERVGEYVDLGILVGHKLAVHPDQVRSTHLISFNTASVVSAVVAVPPRSGGRMPASRARSTADSRAAASA